MKEFGLYIHVPFCIRKCHYCDFNSVKFQQKLSNKFLSALQQEIELLDQAYHPTIKSIFIGGGTPTVLTGKELNLILEKCYQKFDCKEDIEITIEANPGTINKKKLLSLRESGINRLSFGVQSFNNRLLERIGRIHTVKQAINNYYLARELGFDNISLDLMFVLPGQSLEDWKDTLIQACELNPQHLSTYNLKIEEGTHFYDLLKKREISLPDEELDLKMYQLTLDILEDAGYKQYEISNFAQQGYASEHNQIYWRNEPYLALGPGAHFYDGVGRGHNKENILDYCQTIKTGKLPIVDYQKLSLKEKIEETLMLGLRLRRGIELNLFKNRYGLSIYDLYQEEIERLIDDDLIKIKGNRLLLTTQGVLLANRVLAEFILS